MTTEADADIRRKETADWFARLNQRKVSTTDVRAFSAWRADSANAAAFHTLAFYVAALIFIFGAIALFERKKTADR